MERWRKDWERVWFGFRCDVAEREERKERVGGKEREKEEGGGGGRSHLGNFSH